MERLDSENVLARAFTNTILPFAGCATACVQPLRSALNVHRLSLAAMLWVPEINISSPMLPTTAKAAP